MPADAFPAASQETRAADILLRRRVFFSPPPPPFFAERPPSPVSIIHRSLYQNLRPSGPKSAAITSQRPCGTRFSRAQKLTAVMIEARASDMAVAELSIVATFNPARIDLID